jgi:hypothetical protein
LPPTVYRMADVYIIGREAFSRVYAVLAFLSETERERERMRERERKKERGFSTSVH